MKKFFNQVENIDISILYIINDSIKCKNLDWFMPKITYLGSTQFSICISLLLFMYPGEYIHKFSTNFIISLIASTLLVWSVKLTFNRTRPFINLLDLYVKKISIDNYSLPSAHSAAAFSMAVTSFMFFPLPGIIFIVLASCVAVSRIYIGVHYPTDVFLGILIGIICSLLIFHFY